MTIMKQLIENMIGDYLNESYEDDLVESIFEEVSDETWEAIQEAILNELSPDTLKRYINKSTRDQDKRKQLARAADNRIADRKVHNPFSTKDKEKRDKTDQQSSDRNWRKAYNREVGQERAVNSMEKSAKKDLVDLSPEDFSKKYKMNKTAWRNRNK
jgi:hypothetical protein